MRNLLIEYTESLRDYIEESHNDISKDERDSSEFADIFLKKKLKENEDSFSCKGDFKVCVDCSGDGKIRRNYINSDGAYVFHKEKCINCDGTGIQEHHESQQKETPVISDEEIEEQYHYLMAEKPYLDGNLRCNINEVFDVSMELAKWMRDQLQSKEAAKEEVKEVYITTNGNGDWLVIPFERKEEFFEDEDNVNLVDSGKFDDKWNKYMTGGDLNDTQLYAEINQ